MATLLHTVYEPAKDLVPVYVRSSSGGAQIRTLTSLSLGIAHSKPSLRVTAAAGWHMIDRCPDQYLNSAMLRCNNINRHHSQLTQQLPLTSTKDTTHSHYLLLVPYHYCDTIAGASTGRPAKCYPRRRQADSDRHSRDQPSRRQRARYSTRQRRHLKGISDLLWYDERACTTRSPSSCSERQVKRQQLISPNW